MSNPSEEVIIGAKESRENLTRPSTRIRPSQQDKPPKRSSQDVPNNQSQLPQSDNTQRVPEPKEEDMQKTDEDVDFDSTQVAFVSDDTQAGNEKKPEVLEKESQGQEAARRQVKAETPNTTNTDPHLAEKEHVSAPSSSHSNPQHAKDAPSKDTPPRVPPKLIPSCPCGDPLCVENLSAIESRDATDPAGLPSMQLFPAFPPSPTTTYSRPLTPRDTVRRQRIVQEATAGPAPVPRRAETAREPAGRGDFLAIRRQLSRINLDIGGLRIGGSRGIGRERRIRSFAEDADEAFLGDNAPLNRFSPGWLKRQWRKIVSRRSAD